jgi:HK97 family phage portal protein
MGNPDPSIYSSWAEFAKQVFWEFQLGEAFVLPMARTADNLPYNFRVIPQWLINAEMRDGRREYTLGSLDVTSEILHIRYKSTTDSARGIGPLESGKARLVAAGVLARYATEIAEGGGIPYYALEVPRRLTKTEADDLLQQWWDSRTRNLGKPAVLSGGVTAKQLQMTPQDMALLELAQFNESRISVLLGVHPFLLALPTPDSMTYSNVDQIFDFHDRRYLKTAATHVMSALSGWALPRGQSAELNRDEYSRPGFKERVEAYEKLVAIGVLDREEIRTMERFNGTESAEALTGGGRS